MIRLYCLTTLFSLLVAGTVHAQQFDVQLASFSPVAQGFENTGGLSVPVMAVEITAKGGAGDLLGMLFQISGNADTQSSLQSVQPGSLWLDNGDSVFDSASDSWLSDASMGQGSLDFMLGTGLAIPDGITRCVWVLVHVTPLAGSARNETLGLAIANAADISATVTVQLLAATIATGAFLFVQYSFVSLAPHQCREPSNYIVITGTGFTTPIVVTIGGQICQGVQVDPDGTSIWGFMANWTSSMEYGKPYDITIETDILGVRVLPQQITFCLTHGIGSVGATDSGCTTSTGSRMAIFAFLPVVLAAAARFRGKRDMVESSA